MSLVEKYRFHIMNISQFYPRPGTPAAKMKRISTQIVKNRSRKLSLLFNSFTPYVGLEKKVVKMWINTEISDDGKHTVGHTKNYTKVLVVRDDTLMGCTATVCITSVSRFHVVAKVMNQSKCITKQAEKILQEMNNNKHMEKECCGNEGSSSSEKEECCGGGSCSSSAEVPTTTVDTREAPQRNVLQTIARLGQHHNVSIATALVVVACFFVMKLKSAN